MTSIFSPIGQQQSTTEQEAIYLEEEFARIPDQAEATANAQLDRDELPTRNRFVDDANNPDLINGNSELPNITIRPRPAHDRVGLIQTARQSFRNELNKYNTPLLRDDQGRIIGQNERLDGRKSRQSVEDFIASKTGRDVPTFTEP